MQTNAGYMPERIIAGESIWIAAANTAQDGEDIIFDDFTPAGGYSLAYQFAAATPITVAAVKNGGETGWTLDVTGAQTLLWAPSKLTFSGFVTHTATARVFAVDHGTIMVEASPLRVSVWAAALTACDAAIANYAATPKGTVTMGDMSVSYRSQDQLVQMRDYIAHRLRQDTGQRQRLIIRARFTTI
jgi:hypothetical protein